MWQTIFPNRSYYLGNVQITPSNEERDLGVVYASDGMVRAQVQRASNTANKVFGMIRRSLHRYTTQIARIIYPTFVRPHLEFASAAWPVTKKGDIKILEAVQNSWSQAVGVLRANRKAWLDAYQSEKTKRRSHSNVPNFPQHRRSRSVRWLFP